jgi:PemK-like, MazF-like toxin of type II toxin-antitoxin system
MRRGLIEFLQQLLRSLSSSTGSSGGGSSGGDSGRQRKPPRRQGQQPGKPQQPARPQQRPKPEQGGSSPTPVGDRIEYSPCLDGDPDPGEVVWTWVPYEEDPTQGKDRPVVIIGRRGDHLLGVPLTSKRHDNEAQVAVGTGPWDREGRDSYAKVERLLDVDPADVRREGAVLDRARFDNVVAGVRAERRL